MQEQRDTTSTGPLEKKPSIEQILQLHSVGILTIKKARDLVNKFYPTTSDPVVKNEPVRRVDGDPNGYSTPPPKPRRRRPSQMDVIDAEINAKVRPEENLFPQRPSKKRKRRLKKASPETTKIRRLVKEITRQRFLSQCMDIDSPLWRKSKSGQRHLNKILFARAAAKPISRLYANYPETLHQVPGRKLMNVIQWQVFYLLYLFFIFITDITIHSLLAGYTGCQRPPKLDGQTANAHFGVRRDGGF